MKKIILLSTLSYYVFLFGMVKPEIPGVKKLNEKGSAKPLLELPVTFQQDFYKKFESILKKHAELPFVQQFIPRLNAYKCEYPANSIGFPLGIDLSPEVLDSACFIFAEPIDTNGPFESIPEFGLKLSEGVIVDCFNACDGFVKDKEGKIYFLVKKNNLDTYFPVKEVIIFYYLNK